MARKLFEFRATRARAGGLASGIEYIVYTDVAGTVLADISASSGGASIAGSSVTTADIAGLGPSACRFYGPTDDSDTLYVRCPSDPTLGVQRVEASADARLDVLEAAGGGDVGVHSADTTAVHGITDTAQIALRNAANTFTAVQTFDTHARFKTRPWVDVTHPTYGAVGDGVNDDTAEIQAALDAGAGGVVFFPAGRYKISATLTVQPRTHLFGIFANASGPTLPGSNLEAAAGMTADMMKNSNLDTGDYWAHGIVIENLSFYAASGQTAGSGLRWCGGENSILRNLFFSGFPDAAIRFQKAQAYSELYNIGAFLGHWGLWFDDADGSANIRGLSGDDNDSLIRISNAIAAPTEGATGGSLTVLVDGVKAEVDANGKHNPLVSCSNLNYGGIIMVGGRVADYSTGSPGSPANKALVKISGTTGSVMLFGVKQIHYPRLIWDEVTGDIYLPPGLSVNDRNGLVVHGQTSLLGNLTRLNLPGSGTAKFGAVAGTSLLAELQFGPSGEVYLDFNQQAVGGDVIFRSAPGTTERMRLTTAGALGVRGEIRVDTDTISWVKFRSTGETVASQVGGNQNTGDLYLDFDKWNGGGDLVVRSGSVDTERVRIKVGGDLSILTVGKGLQVKEGSNAKMGTATLVGGTVTVATTAVTANSRILLTSQVDGGTPGFLRVSSRTAATSFVVTSSSGSDTSTVAWFIVEPA